MSTSGLVCSFKSNWPILVAICIVLILFSFRKGQVKCFRFFRRLLTKFDIQISTEEDEEEDISGSIRIFILGGQEDINKGFIKVE